MLTIFDGHLLITATLILVIWAFVLYLLFRKKTYGVCHAVVVDKHKRDAESTDSVDIWCEESQQYCQFIPLRGGTEVFYRTQPGDRVVIYRSSFSIFAVRTGGRAYYQ